MRPFLIGICLACLISEATAATKRKFPYEATVIENDVYVRSGPGRKYYPTQKLKSGDHLTVHRHDLGGWYMVAPPPGSFSWIRSEYIQRTGSSRGVLTENDVVVRVGSRFGDDHDVEQRRLSKGDEVDIIGQATLSADGRSIRMLKIRPPRGEFRWINGKSVVSSDQAGQSKLVRDPFANLTPSTAAGSESPFEKPSAKTRSQAEPIEGPFDKDTDSRQRSWARENRGNELIERPLVRTSRNGQSIRDAEASNFGRDPHWPQLQRLDAQFRDLINQDISRWDFSQLENDYLNLQDNTDNLTLANEVDRRLIALKRFKKIKQEYDNLARVTIETNQRDAKLLALQRQRSQKTKPDVVTNSKLVAPDPSTARSTRGTEGRRLEQKSRRRVSGFDGAGIIQRSATTYRGAPRHVLLAPGGRILAYLQPDKNTNGGRGINLDRYLGRAMGVYGSRSFRADLQTDFILVRDLTPVRLRP